MTAALFPRGFSFIDPDVVQAGLPLREFATLREVAPVWWNAQPAGSSCFNDGGFWVISRHDDIRAISRDHQTWSARENGVALYFPDIAGPDQLESTKALLLNHDPPEHTRLRKIISRTFTPRAVGELEARLRASAEQFVVQAAGKDSGDFVADIAAKLPVLAMADLLGVPADERAQVFQWADDIVAMDDPDAQDGDPLMASAQLLGWAFTIAEKRRAHPEDDIITRLIHADVDGQWMTDEEFGFFVLLLAIAGNETTRNAISNGLNAFMDNPYQWELFKRHRPRTAADEIVRWTSPVHAFQRTAMRDVELGGVHIYAGQRVGMFYGSANYDETVFEEPFRFDIFRDPNPHLGFGGGTHFCIGASLARLEIRLIFEAIAEHLPDITKTSEPWRLRSGLVNGVKAFNVRYH